MKGLALHIRNFLIGTLLLIALTFVLILHSFLHVNPIPMDGKLSGGAVQIKQGFVSVAAIPSGDRHVILVDCGDDTRATAIIEGLRRMGMDQPDVKAILLTHAHPDHIAGCGVFAGAAVYAMAAERPLIERRAKQRTVLGVPIGKPNDIHVSRYLQNGDSFEIGNITVSAYLIPGHTDGSAAYLAAGTLYLGDSADGGRDGQLVPAKRFVSKDVGQNRISLASLAEELRPRASEISTMEFAHSGPLLGIKALLDFSAKAGSAQR